MPTPQTIITRSHIEQALSYSEYVQLSETLLAEGRTTSDSDNLNTPKHLEYTKLNLQRMNRIYKTTTLHKDLQALAQSLQKPQTWIILSESWCGDAAQCIPVWMRLAEQSPLITLKLLLRDKHPAIMDAYLTGTSRSIPKVICLDTETLDEIGHWGPRPQEAQEYVLEQKAQHTDHDTMIANVHAWYAKDKTQSLQREMFTCLQAWKG